jgi:hypothetical protein
MRPGNNIRCIPIGTKVRIGKDIEGIIISIRIYYAKSVKYMVEWWDGKERREEELFPLQFTPIEDNPILAIGFHMLKQD